jgi:hypothetical protein
MKSILVPVFIALSSSAIEVCAQDQMKPLEDNSFLLEEAFNQEARVIQHIVSATFNLAANRDLSFNFTQEWPLGSQLHQFSVGVPSTLLNDGGATGLNDVLLNYRYQLLAEEDKEYLAPRLSIILPTGVERLEGEKGLGFQFAIPYSRYLSEAGILHLNAGVSLASRKSDPSVFGPKLVSAMLGGSGIWLTTPRFNVLCEIIFASDSEEDNSGAVMKTRRTIVSPGFRYGIDVGALQIVPGLAFPISVRTNETRMSILLYLSFEHPY